MLAGFLVGCGVGGSFWLVWVLFVGLLAWVGMVGTFWWLVLWFTWVRIVSAAIVVVVRLATLLGVVALWGLAGWVYF